MLLAVAGAALTTAQSAQAAICSAAAVTVTPMHSPDGTQRPFYADFGNGSTNHSGYAGYELSGASLGSDVWIKLSGFTGGKLGLAANQSASIPARATSQAGKPLVYAYLTATAATTSAQTFTVEVWNGRPGQTGSSQVCTTTDGFSAVEDVIKAAANKITSISVSNSSPAIGGAFDVTAAGDTGQMGVGIASDRSGGNGVFSMAPAMDDAWPADAFTLTGVRSTLAGTTYRDRLRVYPGAAAEGAYTSRYDFTVRTTTSGATQVLPVQSIASGTQVKYTGTYPGVISQISAPALTMSLVKSAVSVVGPPYKIAYQVLVSNSASSPVTLDYLRDTPTPAGSANWSFEAGSAKLGGSTISDPTLDAGALVFSGPFSVPANSSLVFTYTLAVSTTITNSVVGVVGGLEIGASSGSGNQVSVDPTAPSVTTATLPNANVGSSYSQALAATAGTGTYTWSVTSGSLPAGLTLAGATGVISGIATGVGTSTFTVTATDGTPKSGSKSLTLTVDAAVVADTTAPTGSLTLNGGGAATSSTTLTLGLGATDAVGVVAYRVAEGSDCTSASWVAVTSSLSFSGSASLTVSSGDGVKTVCAQYKDAAGNISTASTPTITLDTVAPTVVLASAAPSPVSGAFTVTATFSEGVTSFYASDVTVANGTVSGFSGSGASYSFTVTPTADGSVTLDVGAGTATDVAGTGNTAATQLARTADLTPPSVSLATAAPSSTSGAFVVTATFSESVTGLTASDVAVGNGTLSGFGGSGTSYSFTVTPVADGAVTVDIAAGGAVDTAANPNTAATQLSRTYDATAPSVALASAAPSSVTGAFTVTATFSESVTGFDGSDVSVGNGTLSGFGGSGTSYSFTVTPTVDGMVTVDVAANGAADTVGTLNTAATQLTRTADVSPPSVSLATTAPSSINGAFVVTATFSKPVTGFDVADVAVGNGAVSGFSGSGAVYTFTVTPAADGAVTVDVASGAAADTGANGSTAAAQLTRTADVTPPSVSLATAAPSSTNGSFVVTATFSEPVTGFSALDVAVTNGAVSGFSGSGTTYTFTVTPAGAGAVEVAVGGGAASEGAGNGNVAAVPLARVYDPVAPVVTLSGSPSATSADGSATFAFGADELVAFSCSLDAAAFGPCSSPIAFTGLAAGEHTFVIRPLDLAGNTSDTTYTWTVRTPTVGFASRVPQPHLVIMAKINPTDMLGRPKSFKQSADGPHSPGPFTRKLQVKLHIPAPTGEGIDVDDVFISNYPDFRDSHRYAIAADELYDWELLAGPSGDRPVYLRFDDSPDALVGEATIVLDQELPTLRPALMRKGVKVSRRLKAVAAKQPIYCGAARRRWLRIPGVDGFSGLNAVQIATDIRHPCGWRPYLPVISYRAPGKVIYLRIEDRVGNVSRWYRIVTR